MRSSVSDRESHCALFCFFTAQQPGFTNHERNPLEGDSLSQITYLSTAQCAAKLGISTQTVLTLAKTGQIEGSFLARRWRFDPNKIDAYVASQRRDK